VRAVFLTTPNMHNLHSVRDVQSVRREYRRNSDEKGGWAYGG
jgi:hypothetical protein